MEQNNWINEVLESTNGMQKAEPSPFLFEKISRRIENSKVADPVKSNGIKWAFAMSTVIIVALNIIVISNHVGGSEIKSSDNDLISNLSAELGYNSNYNY